MVGGRVASHSRALAGIAAIVLLASLIEAAPDVARGTDLDAARVATGVVRQDPAAVRAYWTPERMREAKPISALIPGTQGQSSRAGAGAAGSSSLHRAVRRVRRFPKRTHGKVFLSFNELPQAGDYVCSGTAVTAPSGSLVVTAGHCLYENGFLGGEFASNWEFVPARRGSHKPFGEWPAADLATTGPYRSSEDVRYDVGMASVASKGGETLQERLGGARGISFNGPRNQTYKAFGYPAVTPPPEFDGRHPFSCRSGYLGADQGENDPKPMRIACDMTAGSSGGGWVVGGGRVASVTSYGYLDENDRLYGPYFGSVVKSLYNAVKSD